MDIDIRMKNLAIAIALLGVLAVVAVSVVPGGVRPSTGLPSEIEHVIAYAAVGLVLLQVTRRPAWIVGFLVSFAAGAEVAQIWIPGRDAAVLDFLAGGLGIAIAYGLHLVASRILHRRAG